MRDTYGTSDLQTDAGGTAKPAAAKGMRHSIRPRRSAVAEPKPVEPTPAPETAVEDVASSSVFALKRATQTAKLSISEDLDLRGDLKDADTDAQTADSQYVLDPSLPRWHELALVETGSRQTTQLSMPVADAGRDTVSVRAFDLLRTRLRQSTQENGWTNIGIVSPSSGCGNTFTAVNLALSLSRISKSRTILMDFNLRSPGVAKAFDVTPRGSMRDFLTGRSQLGDHIVRVSDTLALGLNDQPDPNSADTLHAPETARTLERMRAALQPELVLYDLPAMLVHDDLSAFLPQLDGVLLVSDGTQTMGRHLLECERMLEGKVPLLGVVLNRARKDSIPQYH